MPRLARYHNWLIYTAIHPALRAALARFATGRLADIGCGAKPYAAMAAPHVAEHVGIDHAGSPHGTDRVDLVGTAYRIPAPDASFDTVLCTDVLEHLEEPAAALAEAVRVLRPGGHGIYTVPLFWPLHEEPRDFYRYTRHGLRHRFEAAGLEVVEIRALTGFWLTFGQALAYWLAGLTRTPWYNPLRWLAWPAIPVVQAGAWLLGRLERGEAFTAEYLAVVRRPAGDGRGAGVPADAGAGPGP